MLWTWIAVRELSHTSQRPFALDKLDQLLSQLELQVLTCLQLFNITLTGGCQEIESTEDDANSIRSALLSCIATPHRSGQRSARSVPSWMRWLAPCCRVKGGCARGHCIRHCHLFGSIPMLLNLSDDSTGSRRCNISCLYREAIISYELFTSLIVEPLFKLRHTGTSAMSSSYGSSLLKVYNEIVEQCAVSCLHI